MKYLLTQLFTSKKFIVMLVGVAVPPLNAAFGWGMGVEELAAALMPVVTYIGGQAHVDANKEKGK